MKEFVVARRSLDGEVTYWCGARHWELDPRKARRFFIQHAEELQETFQGVNHFELKFTFGIATIAEATELFHLRPPVPRPTSQSRHSSQGTGVKV